MSESGNMFILWTQCYILNMLTLISKCICIIWNIYNFRIILIILAMGYGLGLSGYVIYLWDILMFLIKFHISTQDVFACSLKISCRGLLGSKGGGGGVNVGGRTNNIINQGISLGQKCIVKIHLHTIAISTINEACFMVGLIFQLNSQKSSFYSNVWKNK